MGLRRKSEFMKNGVLAMAICSEGKVNAVIAGKVRAAIRTKELLPDLEPGAIAVLRHSNLDVTTAELLVHAGVGAVVNAEPFITGDFPAGGARVLLGAGVPLFEMDSHCFFLVENGAFAYLDGSFLTLGKLDIPCRRFNAAAYTEACERASLRYPQVCYDFIRNTLFFANAEKEWVAKPAPLLHLGTVLKGRTALVVIRGPHHLADLIALIPYIRTARPVLIGVDGGADAIIQCGFVPDLIVGDMDSVSDAALFSGAEIVVHAYTSGTAPGLARVTEAGLTAKLWSCPGTSEDAALLLAEEHGAERIVAVGTHTGVLDYLDKGRSGMGSSLLVRIKLGGKLIDAKGFSVLATASSTLVNPPPAVNGQSIGSSKGLSKPRSSPR